MSSLYAFRCSTPEFRVPDSVLVVFCGLEPFSAAEVGTAVWEATRVGPPPEMVLLLAPTEQANQAADMERSHSAWDPLSRYGTVIQVLAYDGQGAFSPQRWEATKEELSGLVAAIRRQGLTLLFRNRGGMLEAGPSAHFVKPSNKLDTRFLRAAHALSEGSEIFFAALWLLPYLGDARVVHVDTPAVASLVLAAQLLKRPSQTGDLPMLRTFRSYDGLDEHTFSRDRRELVLISASQSGSMADKLRQRIAEPEDVITLFSLGDSAEGTTVLCDLRHDHEHNIHGYEPITSAPTGLATRPIRIIGEHFIAEPGPARAVLPLRSHAPTVLKTLGLLAGVRAFSVLRLGGKEEKAPWLDVGQLLTTPEAAAWLRRQAMPKISLATRALVRTDDSAGTKALVDSIRAEIQAQTGQAPKWTELSLADLEGGAKRDWTVDESPVLVVAGAVGHGLELLSASRALRDYAPDSRRLFMTSAIMGADEEVNRVLKSNLGYGGHEVVSMFELTLDRRLGTGSWRRERDRLSEFEGDLPPELEARLERLQATAEGLTDDLFLTDGDPLKLRDGFAFWTRVHEGTTQADVFVTVATLLEHLRSGASTPPDARLLNDPQTQSVLAPETFSRFNDGVIQAALLRAALPVELNYAGSPDQSRHMADLILRMVDLRDRPQGEALCEFLMAFWLGRLVLDGPRTHALRQELLARAADLPPIARWLARLPS